MSSLTCRFCVHRNPDGSKFCNECGSPLNLVPCPQCEAVNSAADDHCFSCGAPLPIATSTADEPAEREPALEVAAYAEPADGFASASIPIALADRLVRPEPALESHRLRATAYDHAEPSEDGEAGTVEAPVETAAPTERNATRSLEWKPNRLRGFLLAVAVVAIAAGVTWTSLMPMPAIAPETNSDARTTAPPSATTPATRSSAPANVEAPAAQPVAAAPSTAAQSQTAPPPQTTADVSVAPPAATDTTTASTAPEPPSSEPAAPPSSESAAPPSSETPAPASSETPAPPSSETAAAPSSETPPTPASEKPVPPPSEKPVRPVRPRSVAKSETRASDTRRHAAADRSREQAERDALATQRLIARELGIAPGGQAPAARRP